jgi:hypothetical protein
MASEPASGARVALVIGNSAYESIGFLANPKRDAAAMAAALQELGFEEVISATDLGRTEFLARLREFYVKLDRTETGLLFYAGHGVQMRGRNYLLPCDAQIARAGDLRTNAVPLDDIVRAMSRRARTRLLFLDACRNDPISDEAGGLTRGVRSAAAAIGSDLAEVGQGLARITATAGTFVAYATEPGNVALDGSGDNSPFTTALLQHIARPGLAVDDILMEVRVDVLEATEGKRLPWSESALTRRFQFKEGPAEPASRDFELEYWNRVKDTDNPDFLQSFLHQFPNGRHAEEARARLGGVARRKEAADWELARSRETIAALANFLRRHPNSARSGAARAKLFLRQFTRGSLMFGSAVAVTLAVFIPLFAYLAHLVGNLIPLYAADPSMAGIPEAEMLAMGVRLLGVSVAFFIGPWIVFGVLLWVTLARMRGWPVRRTALAFVIALVPMVICIGFVGAESARQNSSAAKQMSDAALKGLQLKQQRDNQQLEALKRAEKEGGVPIPDLGLVQQVAKAEREVEALTWRLSHEKRFIPLLGAGVAAITAFLTLLLCAAAVSGRRQVRLWGPSIRGGALVAAVGVLGWSIYSHSAWNDATLAVLFSVWVSVCGFLALGLVRAAASADALPGDSPAPHAP